MSPGAGTGPDEVGVFLEELPAADEPAFIALRGHLLVEELLERLVALQLPRPGELAEAGLGSWRLIALARAAVPERADPGPRLWAAVSALNDLRNTVVHERRPETLDEEIDDLLTLCPPPEAPGESVAPRTGATASARRGEGLRRSIAALAATVAGLGRELDG